MKAESTLPASYALVVADTNVLLSAALLPQSTPVKVSIRTFSRDSSDDAFIHTALAADVCRLITGDQDLLVLHPLDSLHIPGPRAALEEIAAMQRKVE